MDLIESISDRFALAQSLYRETVDLLAGPIAAAAERLAEGVLAGQRVWVVSSQAETHLAAHFVDRLWFGSRAQNRPPFAATLLPDADGENPDHPLNVLVQPGDPIIALFGTTPSNTVERAVAVATETDCPLIAIGHDGSETLWPRLRDSDVPIALPELSPSLRDELLLFVLNALMETWEQILFGDIG